MIHLGLLRSLFLHFVFTLVLCASLFVVCGRWFALRGLWFVVRSSWFVVRASLFAVHGSWFTLHCLWFVLCVHSSLRLRGSFDLLWLQKKSPRKKSRVKVLYM